MPAFEPALWAQLLRLLLVPLGHVTGRLPLGNPGTSRVNPFRPMPLTPEAAQMLAECRRALVSEKGAD